MGSKIINTQDAPSFSELLKSDGFIYFDGGMGTLLHSRGLPAGMSPEIWGITRPDVLVKAHREYIEAGADIIKTNTFGVNGFRCPSELGYSVERFVTAAVRNVRRASEGCGRKIYTALDIGPTGRLVGQEISFDEAYDAFLPTVRAGADICDLVLIETFGELAELRAAILCAKDNCDLPVVVTGVFGADGRTFTGVPAAVMGAVAEAMGADAFGMNCSAGPDLMLWILPSVVSEVSIPVCVNPNAGLPRGSTSGSASYSCGPEEFAEKMKLIAEGGALLVGGCCGTTPAHIEAMKSRLEGLIPEKRRSAVPSCRICSSSSIFRFGDGRLAVIGERINPTGKKRFKEALRAGDSGYAMTEAVAQTANGADILDINVGIPEIDEKKVLAETVASVQKICQLPLQIDTASPEAMEAALRQYNGIPLINSVNGREESMSRLLPLAKRYGGVLIALTLDGNGIPDTPEGRLAIAERIVARAESMGIGRERIIVDPLTLTLGADPQAAEKTLGALRLIKEKLGVRTSLGVSNISFGLPDRETVNISFLRAAIEAGLDAAIMNPGSEGMMRAARGFESRDGESIDLAGAGSASVREGADLSTLSGCIAAGISSEAVSLAEKLCAAADPQELITGEVIPALDRVGRDFEAGRIFLPGLLASADAAVSSLAVITSAIGKMSGGSLTGRGKVVLATVEGDIHDIGKNIVGVMLRSYGFEVIDLGKNVPPAAVCDACTPDVKLVGLSALMTTTVPSMARTIAMLRERAPWVRVIVGGAVLTAGYAKTIGADAYSPDAIGTVRYAEEIYSKNLTNSQV
ncbi:MAG: homocysteine S-methyltransferase family protein [Clostridia bacterium]|nr:homocysteine S-methyltransferase family protein [Clostridia bacterium]